MKFLIDHDYHIHSQLSSCSSDPQQTTEAILRYGKQNGFKKICLTDHFWDDTVPGASEWYKPQNFDHIKKALPLPKMEGIEFFFGAETDMDKFMTVGCSQEMLDRLDFLIIPTTHLHMKGFTYFDEDNSIEGKIMLWEKRLHALLDKDLPWHKIGLAHITCDLIEYHIDIHHVDLFARIADEVYAKAFSRCAQKGIGVELNFDALSYSDEQLALDTTEGKLLITGKDIKIGKFSSSERTLTFTGQVNCIKYSAPSVPLIKRIFK